MKCTILGQYIRQVGKAIQALAKIGEELYLEPKPEGLAFRTMNSSRSAVMTFKFDANFFEYYEEKSPDDIERIPATNPELSSQNPSKCRLMMRSILMVFNRLNVLEKTVEFCHINVLPNISKVKIQLICKYSVTKLYTFPFIESERLEMYHDVSNEGNSFSCHAKVLNEAVINFLRNQEEVTMIATPDKFVMKNYISSNPQENQNAVHTELTMYPNEFQTFEVNSESSITYCLKELRAIISLADAFDLPLNATYGAVNEPIYFTVSRPEVFEGSLVMATMASEDPADRANCSIASSLDTSQSNSTFRSTEDLLHGHHSRSRPKPSKPSTVPKPTIRTSTSFLRRSESSSSVQFLNEVQERNRNTSQPILTPSQGQGDISSHQTPGGEPRTSTLDIAQGSPPRFSEGLHDLLDETENLVNSPPSKRAKFFFQRCFEKTIDLRSVESQFKLLAPDSDEEN